MLKLADNPPILPPGVTSISELPGPWWVAHTRSRFEKAFAWDLLRQGIGYFLPLVQRVTLSGGKKRRVMTPLFQSYVFFCGDPQHRYQAMTTNRLCSTIEVVDQNGLVSELASIERALNGHAVLDPYPFAVVGQRCRICSGAFAGLEGIVVQRSKTARLVLQVSILGQAAAMEIDADLLEPVD